MKVDSIEIQFEKDIAQFDSVLVVLTYQNKIIYVKNRKRNWELTGGKSDLGESMNETAIREAYEESGAVFGESDIQYLGYYVLPDGHVTTIVKAEVNYFKDIPVESETIERYLAESPLDSEHLSFQDGLYGEIFKYLGVK